MSKRRKNAGEVRCEREFSPRGLLAPVLRFLRPLLWHVGALSGATRYGIFAHTKGIFA